MNEEVPLTIALTGDEKTTPSHGSRTYAIPFNGDRQCCAVCLRRLGLGVLINAGAPALNARKNPAIFISPPSGAKRARTMLGYVVAGTQGRSGAPRPTTHLPSSRADPGAILTTYHISLIMIQPHCYLVIPTVKRVIRPFSMGSRDRMTVYPQAASPRRLCYG